MVEQPAALSAVEINARVIADASGQPIDRRSVATDAWLCVRERRWRQSGSEHLALLGSLFTDLGVTTLPHMSIPS